MQSQVKLELPDFRTASVKEMLEYMRWRNFKGQANDRGYVVFESDGGEPNCTRYSMVFDPEIEPFRDFLGRLCVWALYRNMENTNTLEPDLLKWENYWYISSTKDPTDPSTEKLREY